MKGFPAFVCLVKLLSLTSGKTVRDQILNHSESLHIIPSLFDAHIKVNERKEHKSGEYDKPCRPRTKEDRRSVPDEKITREHHVASNSTTHKTISPRQAGDSNRGKCINGKARGGYSCENVNLESRVTRDQLETSYVNDIWGWTDPQQNEMEYAIVGMYEGTAFVDISTPTRPRILGILEDKNETGTWWRDIKTYGDYAFIVADQWNEGMQVFDLTQLRGLTEDPERLFVESARLDSFSYAHNIAINEESGTAYVVGSDECWGGLHMVNIKDPLNPFVEGCYGNDGYTHDAQCIIYNGPDMEHRGKEICFACNEDHLAILDVTNRTNVINLASLYYEDSVYVHQGWLTEDRHFFLVDEEDSKETSETFIIDISNLDRPFLKNTYQHNRGNTDHNQFVKGRYTYQANYKAGLRILDTKHVSKGSLLEVASFDVYRANDDSGHQGAWGVYPYFDSGLVIVTSTSGGLFILTPDFAPSVRISSPEIESTVSGSNAVFATDVYLFNHDVLNVDFFLDAKRLESVQGNDGPNYAIFWNTESVDVGDYILSAKATDEKGITVTSQDVPIVVQRAPTISPTVSVAPTSHPTVTSNPTKLPTRHPTREPTNKPSYQPTLVPIPSPTLSPTRPLSVAPTRHPTATLKPTKLPIRHPTREPTNKPSYQPTLVPIPSPTLSPTRRPSQLGLTTNDPSSQRAMGPILPTTAPITDEQISSDSISPSTHVIVKTTVAPTAEVPTTSPLITRIIFPPHKCIVLMTANKGTKLKPNEFICSNNKSVRFGMSIDGEDSSHKDSELEDIHAVSCDNVVQAFLVAAFAAQVSSLQYKDEIQQTTGSIYRTGNSKEMRSLAATAPECKVSKTANKGTKLKPNEFICSNNKSVRFGMSIDGIFSVWDNDVMVWSASYKDEFSPCTVQNKCVTSEYPRVYLQSDGNLVVRNKNGKSMWSQKTNKNAAASIKVNDDGSVEMFQNGIKVWTFYEATNATPSSIKVNDDGSVEMFQNGIKVWTFYEATNATPSLPIVSPITAPIAAPITAPVAAPIVATPISQPAASPISSLSPKAIQSTAPPTLVSNKAFPSLLFNHRSNDPGDDQNMTAIHSSINNVSCSNRPFKNTLIQRVAIMTFVSLQLFHFT
eukprot:CAMPEP_0194393994 /NCGR_PEP_ID=MMETSP0174-20130528/123607_1 /TAXON_ID=216777 /ORGANISM="Proboscia alata, Strain PI-D3" /LENGTH=1123 /DNA_ID=CAMNT_0039189741 /DNA_START=197 /DNA_END=3565 /DNA_ORIENTATION=-